MKDYKSLAHTRWDCKCHIVFIPKCRKKIIYGKLKLYMGETFHELASHRESKIEEGLCVIGRKNCLLSNTATGTQACAMMYRFIKPQQYNYSTSG